MNAELRRVSPTEAVIWTLSSILVAGTVPDPTLLAIYAGSAATFCCLRVRDSRPMRRMVSWTLPFVLPLLLIHGLLNSAFPATGFILGVPIRESGMVYGALVAARIATLTSAAVFWGGTASAEVFSAAVRCGLPTGLVVLVAMSISGVNTLRRRAKLVLEAQQARGVPIHGGVWARVRSLSAVTIPVVVSAVVEADQRAVMLAIRGLGSGSIVVASPPDRDAPWYWLLTPVLLPVIVLLAEWVA